MVFDHSERFPLTGLLSLSAILPTTWEGPSGCTIGVACSSSLSHTWAVILSEVASSLLKKLKWPHHLSGLWTTLHLCWKQLDNCHGSSVAWPHIPCVLKTSHSRGILIFAMGLLPISRVHSLRVLKRHSDIYRGIATYIASPLTTPTQEAFWYLPWDHSPFCCKLQAHSMPHSLYECCLAALSFIVWVLLGGPLIVFFSPLDFIVRCFRSVPLTWQYC